MVALNRSMMVFLVLALSVFGCATVKVSQDYDVATDFSGLETFAWQADFEQQTGKEQTDNPLMDARMRSAIEKTLTEKGFRKTEAQPPDFEVAYRMNVRRKIDSGGVRTGVGIGIGGSGTFGSVGVSGSPVREIEEAVLVIDITNAKSGKLMWRGTGTYEFRRETDPQKTTAKVNEAVAKILAQFPPQAG